MFKFGLEKILQDKPFVEKLKSKRVALVAHPASVDAGLNHSIDVLSRHEIQLSACFGPQHGMRGEKQDNMIESDDYRDPKYDIPVFSLYGKFRRPTPEMLDTFDVVLVDLQDVGCRIYTFLTTLFYLLDACTQTGKEIVVLDRPNPAGRNIEGLKLDMQFSSFVGAAPLCMRHGLTLGEAANWYRAYKKLDVNLNVIACEDYNINRHSWPQSSSWVNPSPNLPRLTGVLSYAGTVLLEGSTLSEGRGTTIPLEVLGAPDIDGQKVLNKMFELKAQWLSGCVLRPCFFEPTFQKHSRKLCSGFQIHLDHPAYDSCSFQPYRLTCLAFKAIRLLYPSYDLWISPPYEYEEKQVPIDILSGSGFLRQWVDHADAGIEDLENKLVKDEQSWRDESQKFYIY